MDTTNTGNASIPQLFRPQAPERHVAPVSAAVLVVHVGLLDDLQFADDIFPESVKSGLSAQRRRLL